MKIIPEKKALVFRLREPSKIMSVIPTAKLVKHKGQVLVAVPHRPDETRVLRNLGFDVPSPMEMHYNWPGGFKPFDAQVQTSSFLTMHSRAFCLNSMGLGKTVSALWSYDYLRRTKQVRKALVVCPLSTMERTWSDEIFRVFPHLEAVVLYGSRERRIALLKEDADLYIVNTDGVKIIRDEMKDRDDIDLVIVDEVAMFRNSGTDRWKALNVICNRQTPRRVWGLTGSPTPNTPTDAWGQCRLVVPDNPDVPKYFNKARERLMRQVTAFKWVPRSDALDTVKEMMQPAVRFALDDCIDLPEQIFLPRDAEMSAEQSKAYKEMVRKLRAEYEGGQITAVNEAVKANKLVQIACGVAYDQGGEDVVLPAGPRIEVLKELIEESEGKVLVFVPLTGVLEHLKTELEKHWTVAVVHGETPKGERDQIFTAFQKSAEPHIILANPGTMSHGLTLTMATTIIWYAPVHSGETWEQANARIRRPGQTKTTVIATIAASDIERRIYDRLRQKQSAQGALLEMMKSV